MGEKGLKANTPVWKWLQITQYDKITSFLGNNSHVVGRSQKARASGASKTLPNWIHQNHCHTFITLRSSTENRTKIGTLSKTIDFYYASQ